MSPADYHWWLNLASTVGIAVLAVPTWSLNSRKKKKKIQESLPKDPVTFRDHVKGILKDKWERDISDWRRIDEVCLVVGYLLLLGSSLFRLFIPLA